ncbi:hypothetical protein INR49_024086 [Caranx melampygus]|nr:hypothetical protein INR49_024086 [Caranx melampygus]
MEKRKWRIKRKKEEEEKKTGGEERSIGFLEGAAVFVYKTSAPRPHHSQHCNCWSRCWMAEQQVVVTAVQAVAQVSDLNQHPQPIQFLVSGSHSSGQVYQVTVMFYDTASHSSPPFTVAFRPLTHSRFPLSLALHIPSFCMCVGSWGGIDDCLSAQATLKWSIAWWLCRLCRGSALCALPRWQSATENIAEAIPELCSTVGWSIKHRVKCSPRDTRAARQAKAEASRFRLWRWVEKSRMESSHSPNPRRH